MQHFNICILVVCLFFTFAFPAVSDEMQRLENWLEANRADGDACLVCQVGLAIIEENVGQNVDFWENFLERLCDLLPTIGQRQACKVVVRSYGIDIILQLLETYNPDYVCGPNILNLCEQCTIDFVDPKSKLEEQALIIRSRMISNVLMSLTPGAREVPPEMYPELDEDGDHFSPVNDLRRTAKWRGRDWFVNFFIFTELTFVLTVMTRQQMFILVLRILLIMVLLIIIVMVFLDSTRQQEILSKLIFVEPVKLFLQEDQLSCLEIVQQLHLEFLLR